MYVCRHELSERRVNHSVAVDPTAVPKGISDDDHLEMTEAVFGASVTGMQVTLVFDEQFVRRKSVCQDCFYF